MDDTPADIVAKETELVRTSLTTKKWYLGLLIMTVVVMIAGIVLKKYYEVVIALPIRG